MINYLQLGFVVSKSLVKWFSKIPFHSFDVSF